MDTGFSRLRVVVRRMSIMTRLQREGRLANQGKNALLPKPAEMTPVSLRSRSKDADDETTRQQRQQQFKRPIKYQETRHEHQMSQGLDVTQPENPHKLETSIVGPPNAGKSSLLNAIVGRKVSIVSPKAQTTRKRVLGAWTQGNTQVCFYDTPGIIPISDAKRFNRELVAAAWDSMRDQTLTLVVFDLVKKMGPVEKDMLERLKEKKSEQWLILSKCDLTNDKARMAEKAEAYKQLHTFDRVFLTSAASMAGVQHLKDELLKKAQPGDWMLAKEFVTDQPDSEIVLETIREQLFRRLNREVPYNLDLKLVSWVDDDSSNQWTITAEILAVTDGQVKMVVGSGGSVINAIKESVQERLGEFFARPVRVFFTVKVNKNFV